MKREREHEPSSRLSSQQCIASLELGRQTSAERFLLLSLSVRAPGENCPEKMEGNFEEASQRKKRGKKYNYSFAIALAADQLN